jgi:hypothetical protein
VLQIAFPPLALTPCPAIIALVAATEHEGDLENATDDAWNKGALTVSGASNNNEDVDEEIIVPCVYEHVVCVSSVAPPPPVPPAPAALTLVSAGLGHGKAVRVWAPGTLITTPSPPNSLASPAVAAGNSIATPIVSGALAVALAINPALGPKTLVDLLLSSSCASTQTLRIDGTMCVPSPDPLVDGRGYFDFLELIRQARVGASRPSLAPCSGGWDPDELAGVGDSKAAPIKVKKLEPMVGFKLIHGDKADLSIHALNQLPLPTVDVDWYDVRFAPDPVNPGNVSAFIVKLTLLIPDPSLGALTMDVFWRTPTGTGIFPLPPQYIVSTGTTASGDLTTLIKMRTDFDYLVRVSARSAASTNCYAGLALDVREIITVFPPPEE